MSKLIPYGENLIVTPLKVESTNSTFYIPESKEAKPGQGEVIAVGPGRELDNGSLSKMTIKVGDKIVFRKYATDEFEIDGEKYLVIPQKDVLAKIDN